VKLLALLVFVAALRVGLAVLADATMVPALLAAVLAGSCMTLWRAGQKTVETQNMLDTSRDGWSYGVACFRLQSPAWLGLPALELTLEEALGLAAALSHLAPVFLFENWGLHGPARYRWAAVLAHTAVAAVVTVLSQERFQQCAPSAQPQTKGAGTAEAAAQFNECWLGLAAGNWVSSSWAAATWWRSACTSGADVGPLQARLPALALASSQLTNFWLAQRSRQPHLLAACVALAGLSMALCCGFGSDVVKDSSASNDSLFLTPAIFFAFCVVSAWMLFQELFASL